MNKFLRVIGVSVVASALVVGAGAAAVQGQSDWPQDQASCEAAGHLWAMDPDGRDQMVCLYVGDGDVGDTTGAPPGPSEQAPATTPPPAAGVSQRPDFTG